MNPAVSVIIPVYNAEKTIQETINSVLKQSFEDFEIVLINDGSTDSSMAIVQSFSDSRIIIIEKENGGVVSSYSEGIMHAKGRYITFLDSDDQYQTDFLKQAVTEMDQYKCSFISYAFTAKNFVTGKSEYRNNGLENGFYDRVQIEKEVYPSFIFNTSRKGCYYSLLVFRWNKIYKKEILQKVVPLLDSSLKQMEDNIFTTLTVLNSESFYISGQSHYIYRIDNDSISKGNNPGLLNQYEKSFTFFKSALNSYELPLKEEQLDYMYFDLLRVVYRRTVKAVSYHESKELLKKMKIHDVVKNLSPRKMKALKNKVFYYCIVFKLYILSYILFRKA